MARSVLIWSFFIAVSGATVATAQEAPTAYRSAQIASVDATRRTLTADFGNGASSLEVDQTIALSSLQVGDAVLIGVREAAGTVPRVVYLRRAALQAAPAPGADVYALPGTPAVRRPMTLVPNPLPYGKTRAVAMAEPVAPVEPVAPAAVTIVAASAPAEDFAGKTTALLHTEPEPEPSPSPLESRRVEGQAELERSLNGLEPLVRELDSAWNGYVRTCPEAASAGVRGWLSPPASASSSSPLCADGLQRVTSQASRVLDGLRAAEDRARAAWVAPGAIRDVLRSRGLEGAVAR